MYLPYSSSSRGASACTGVSHGQSLIRSHMNGPRTKRDELSLRVVLALPNASAAPAHTLTSSTTSQRALTTASRHVLCAHRTFQDRVRVEQLVLDMVDILA